ncbi:Growth arrest-specific protein 1 [Araneus ventricosus]|uniref:Growth arrest-specific protein 1 n=1 Tax=Araneus ventricosus TaxID=182803 RepID=A0A4Y2ESI5_ARAVE|nr:Growth arrest-specific protein 1 [Araneus ventricosus]
MMSAFFLGWCLGPLMFWLVKANTLPAPQDCELARAKCAYRASCYKSLHSYMVDCADVLAGRTTRCPYACQRALISLTSTEFGLSLSTCDCGDNEFCKLSKERIEVCRPEVSHATADDTVVSCSVAKWICAADTLCSTALDYYHRLCRPMFHGRKCTPRCNNSLAILDRQEKASKLKDCYCDGSEDFPCLNIKRNTQKLCYGNDDWNGDHHFPMTTPETQSSSCTGTPCGLLFYLIVCTLPLLACRTSDGESHLPLSKPSDEVEQTVHARHMIDSDQLMMTSRVTKHWPWWWTSENVP